MTKYEVVVGNVGMVYNGKSKHEAWLVYMDYVGRAVLGIGRAAGEEVTLLKNGKVVMEHNGEGEQDE